MLCTKRGYRSSVIFSLFAKSRALSKGILHGSCQQTGINGRRTTDCQNLPYAFEMHRADLDDMANLFALEDTVSPSTSHTGDI